MATRACYNFIQFRPVLWSAVETLHDHICSVRELFVE